MAETRSRLGSLVVIYTHVGELTLDGYLRARIRAQTNLRACSLSPSLPPSLPPSLL
jgi:hypothetical protein